MAPVQPLMLIDHPAHPDLVRSTFAKWHSALRDGSKRLGRTGPSAAVASERLWLGEDGPQAKLVRRAGSPVAPGEYEDAAFRLDAADVSGGWIVQVNLSLGNAADTRLAEDGHGTVWVLRLGNLKNNGVTPEIDEATFRAWAPPLRVLNPDKTGASGAWYAVAAPDVPSHAVLAATRGFVRGFAMVRAKHGQEQTRGGLAPGHEPIAPYWLPASAEKEVQQRQGKVMDRLTNALAEMGIAHGKLEAVDGFSCDLWIEPPHGPLLVEVKTSTAAADIHMGIGQLTLYPEILKVGQHLPFAGAYRRVLLLPEGPIRTAQLDAAARLGFLVHRYRVAGDWKDTPLNIEFDGGFRELCGLQ